MDLVSWSLVLVGAYLLGSIPTGFLVGRSRGVDIRQVGSGNIGATNVLRILGKPAGFAVLLIDALKGWLAVVIVPRLTFTLVGTEPSPSTIEYYQVVAGVAAVLGHNYTLWLRFKGGKGIATSSGVLLALVPWPLLIIFAVWVVVTVLTRYISLASICASAVLPFACWLTGESPVLIWTTAGLAALAIFKHRANIMRLLKGTESRLGVREVRQ